MPRHDLADRDYVALADFRHQLRRFLAFSEERARAIGLEPRQHQLLLALRGLPADVAPTVGALAERLLLRHHTVVELVDRLQRRGLVRRTRASEDRRQTRLAITARGRALLARLSIEHQLELASAGPALVASLRRALRGRP
ncbi:MAG TPA: MarR family transcriptional regulator [Kofleriaceae bacterium]|nr:MarR family transcriptional regulator [Kofleriaceae bacterium]